jgi:Polyketide cyclase / dehydrase and lipid transport
VDLRVTFTTPAPPVRLAGVVQDLRTYPRWLGIVTRVEGLATGDGPPAFLVDLTGRLGPLARSKRLRMAETAREAGLHSRFERAEDDGRQHSPWVLDVRVEPAAEGSTLHMDLHYGGGLFGPVLERVLRDEIEKAKPRLVALLAEPVAEP